MSQNPGFENLKALIEEFISNAQSMDLKGRVSRAVAAGASHGLQRAQQEFPADQLKDFVNGIYNMVADQRIADNIALAARSIDVDGLNAQIEGMLESLKDEDTAAKLAKPLSDLLSRTDFNDLKSKIEESGAFDNMHPMQRLIAQQIVGGLLSQLEGSKNLSPEDMAKKIQSFAENVSADQISMAVYAGLQNITPERVSLVTNKAVGSLPPAASISDLFHGVTGAAIKQLDRIATQSEEKANMNEFSEDVRAAIAAAKNGSPAAPKKPGGNGGLKPKRKF